MKVLNKSKIESVLKTLSEEGELFVPLSGQQSGFQPFQAYDTAKNKLMLDDLNVVLPPKSVLLPCSEKMYDIKKNGVKVEIDKTFEDSHTTIIFGVRPCDMQAISSLDEVFLTHGYEDSFYKARRSNTTIIAHACSEPGPNCFCESMGVKPSEAAGADVLLKNAGDEYIWEAKTPKGEALTAKIAGQLEEKEAKADTVKSFKRQVNYDGVAEKLKGMFEHPLWEELSQPCTNCGICAYICPSCYCFDIQVKMKGETGYRFRCYDSCMYEEYTRVAGGGNPRPSGLERFRNRFLHKLEFFTERYGRPLCTGCGRCIVECPNGISIVNVIQKIKEAAPSAES